MKTRAELVAMLDALEADLPDLLAEVEPDDRLGAFAGRADDITECAGSADCEYVSDRLEAMIHAYGLAESDDET